MAYELHITRHGNWFDKQAEGISLETWRTFVETDAELQIVSLAEVSSPKDGTVKIECAGLTRWNGHPNSQTVWLLWNNGNISCRSPDTSSLAKLIQIASRLNSHVQGDEGELYN